jgi:hypothetical protein
MRGRHDLAAESAKSAENRADREELDLVFALYGFFAANWFWNFHLGLSVGSLHRDSDP